MSTNILGYFNITGKPKLNGLRSSHHKIIKGSREMRKKGFEDFLEALSQLLMFLDVTYFYLSL